MGCTTSGTPRRVELLEVDHLLHRGGVAAAVLGRPSRNEPAVVEELALPAPRPFGDVRRGPDPLGTLFRAREILLEPFPHVVAERLGLVVVVEAHRRIVPECPSVRCQRSWAAQPTGPPQLGLSSATGLVGEEHRSGDRPATIGHRRHRRRSTMAPRDLAVAGVAAHLEAGLVEEPEAVKPAA